MQYAIINNGVVENVIEWDGETALDVEGSLAPSINDVEVGATWDGIIRASYTGAVVTAITSKLGGDQAVIDHTGLPWGEDVDLYKMVGSTFTPFTQSEVDAVEAAREAEQNARLQRLEDIATSQTASGLRVLTVAQAETYIDTQMDAVTSLAEAKVTITRIFKKMVPYLLS
jgi:hypothetical protein